MKQIYQKTIKMKQKNKIANLAEINKSKMIFFL